MDGMRPVAVSSTASSRRWLPKPAILGSRGDTLEAFEDGETGGRGGGAAEVGETWGSVSTLFWLSVFTCIGVPLRAGRKPWAGRTVSLDL